MTADDIPTRLQHRPRDKRGYVVPFVTFIDKDGEPAFKIMDDERVRRCLDHRLCGLCGNQMGRHIFFIGGNLCVVNGIFYDPPMHRECAEHAMRTCPHIVNASGKLGRIPEASEVGVAKIAVGQALATTRFAMMHGERYTYRHSGSMHVIKAELPWKDVVWWHEGEPERS